MDQTCASYWIVMQSPTGEVTRWMWNCETCFCGGLATTEAQVVTDMNGHVAKVHPQSEYAAPPIPD